MNEDEVNARSKSEDECFAGNSVVPVVWLRGRNQKIEITEQKENQLISRE